MNAAKYTLLMCNDCHSTSQSVRKSSAPSELHYFLGAFHDASKYRSNTWIVCLRFQINWPMIIPMRKHCVRFACTFICTVWCKIYVVIMSERRRAGRFDQRQSVNRVHSVWKLSITVNIYIVQCTMAHVLGSMKWRDFAMCLNEISLSHMITYQIRNGWMDGRVSERVNVYLYTFRSKHVVVWTVPCHAIPFHVRFVFALQSISSCKPNTHTDSLCRTQIFPKCMCWSILFERSSELNRNEMIERETATRLGGCLQRCTEMDLDFGAIRNWNVMLFASVISNKP